MTHELPDYITNEKNKDFWIRRAMLKFGGSFVKSLAECMERADNENYARLTMAFPEILEVYRKLGEELEAKEYGL